MSAAAPTSTITSLRIIVLALMGGLMTFGVIAVVLRQQGLVAPVPQAESVLPIVVLVTLLVGVGVSVLVRSRLLVQVRNSKREALAELRAERVPQALSLSTILGAALVEGPGLLGIITVLVGGPWYCIAAPLIAIGVMLWTLPSRQRFEEAVQGL